MRKNNKDSLTLSLLSYVIVAVFLFAFIFFYVLSNIVKHSLGWDEISGPLILVISLICVTPLFIPIVWGRLTKIRLFEFEVGLSEATAEISQNLPNELKDAKRMQLGTTLAPEIVNQLTNVIRSSAAAELVEVNLGYGRTWVATRLYFLASLCVDYTEIKHIVFIETSEGIERVFIGMAPPRVVKRILELEYPILEQAYKDASLRSTSLGDESSRISDTEEINSIVQNFGNYLHQFSSGDEGELKSPGVKEWVTKSLLLKHISFDKYGQSIEWESGASISPILLYRIIKASSQYIPLIQNKQLTKIVDRFELSIKIADFAIKQHFEG